jgi:hypothetical protein
MISVVFDSSALISLVETCNSPLLYFLKEKTASNFLITPKVKDEIISNPLAAKKYELSAIRMRRLLLDGVLSVISSPQLVRDTKEIMNCANTLLYANEKPLTLIQEGEAQCLAIFSGAKADALAVDEKTTRLLIEDPFKLKQILQSEYDEKIEVNENSLKKFREKTRGIFVIRSTELVSVAASKGFFRDFRAQEQEAFHAALHALREVGCAITSEELAEYDSVTI